MLRKMQTEILFLDPDDVGPCSATLVEHGFSIERLDWTDPYGPTVWIMATIDSDLSQDRFFDWIAGIVEPLHGDVVEAGLSHPQQAA